jgi:hypothetical protein
VKRRVCPEMDRHENYGRSQGDGRPIQTSLAGAAFSLAGTAALAGYTPRWAGSCRGASRKELMQR